MHEDMCVYLHLSKLLVHWPQKGAINSKKWMWNFLNILWLFKSVILHVVHRRRKNPFSSVLVKLLNLCFMLTYKCLEVTMRSHLGNYNIFSSLENIRPQWWDRSCESPLLVHYSWECVKFCTPLGKGNAPRQLGRKEKHKPQSFLENCSERNRHNRHVMSQWDRTVNLDTTDSELPLWRLVKKIKMYPCAVTHVRQTWESRWKWKCMMSVLCPQWWYQSISWRLAIWSCWECLRHEKNVQKQNLSLSMMQINETSNIWLNN